jgi:hypothetical protein
MKSVTFPGLVCHSFCNLLNWQYLPIVYGKSSEGWSSVSKRYYHHEVHLDDTKHDEQFFSFVTVSLKINVASYTGRYLFVWGCSDPILMPRNGTLKCPKTSLYHQDIGSPHHTQTLCRANLTLHGVHLISTTVTAT